ncbi:MAG TPA: hypothetical protein VM370_12515 [Candidatus Thermoplasmatota archaeon]|nr:hypothetical protein [Candidatus Thermoplasmatota archaeon]
MISRELSRERTREARSAGPAARVRIAAEFQQVVIQMLSQPTLLLMGHL